ncbi:MAG TPA: hypothetical protein VIX42_00565 [Edaphobacter sp.]
MERAVDSFWLDLTLHHPNCDPIAITQALGLQPWHSAKVGQVFGPVTRKSTVWMSYFREGIQNEEFAQALEDFMALLETQQSFLISFIDDGGDILLTVNQSIASDDGILFSLQLESFFLETLGNYGVGLRIQAWSAETSESLKRDISEVERAKARLSPKSQ